MNKHIQIRLSRELTTEEVDTFIDIVETIVDLKVNRDKNTDDETVNVIVQEYEDGKFDYTINLNENINELEGRLVAEELSLCLDDNFELSATFSNGDDEYEE